MNDDNNNSNRNKVLFRFYNISFKIFFILVSMVFGVPTVRRQQQTYLIQTLINIISNMNQTEQKDSLIVVMIGEVTYTCDFQYKNII